MRQVAIILLPAACTLFKFENNANYFAEYILVINMNKVYFMIFLRRIFTLCISIILLLGVTGCMNNNNDTTSKIQNESIETVQEKVLSHLENKYGKEFQCLASEGASTLRNYYTFIISEKGVESSSSEFKAFYYPEEDENFKDAYFGIALREIIAKRIITETQLDDTKSKVFIKFRNTSFSNDLNMNSSLEDAVKIEGEIDSVLYVFGVKKIAVESIVSELKNAGITGTLYFYEIDEGTFSTLTYDTYEETISDIISKKIEVNSESKTSIE